MKLQLNKHSLLTQLFFSGQSPSPWQPFWQAGTSAEELATTQVGSYVPGARTHFRSTVLETKEVSR